MCYKITQKLKIRMKKITIIGSGNIGLSLSYGLILRELVSKIVMIDK